MTTQEKDRIQNAIRHIQTAVDVDPWACELAVEALEKMMPKPPIMGYAFPEKLRTVLLHRGEKERAEAKTECCPVCGRTLGVSQFVKAQSGLRFGDPHCKRCGQAIDWTEGEGCF